MIEMKNKKAKWMFMVLLMLSVTVRVASADTFIYLSTTFDGEGRNIEGFSVMEDNLYYMDYFVTDEELTRDTIIIKDSQGNILHTDRNTDYYPLPFYEGISTIEIYRQNNLVFSKTLSFCNNNNVCEPCEGADCSLSENSATCDDCVTGSPDLYCDLKEEGICDPDCDGMDMDCPGCDEKTCYHEGSVGSMNICDNLGGEICVTIEECAGEIVDYTSEGYCCLGFCVDPTVDEEYVAEEEEEVVFTGASEPQGQYIDEGTDPVVLFKHNYDSSIPVEDESKKIYCEDVGKSACEYLEKCLGERIYSDDEGYDCCTGDCEPLPEKEFREAYEKVFGEEYKEAEKIMPPEEVLPEEAPGEFVFAPEIRKISPLWLLLLIVPVAAAVLAFSMRKKKDSEREKRLEYECSYYKNYGYSGEQLKNILKDRGWKKEEIKKTIKK